MAKDTKNLSFIHSQKIPSNKWPPVSVLFFFVCVLLHRKTGTIFNFYFVFKIIAFSFVSLRICFIKSIICMYVYSWHIYQLWPKKKQILFHIFVNCKGIFLRSNSNGHWNEQQLMPPQLKIQASPLYIPIYSSVRLFIYSIVRYGRNA